MVSSAALVMALRQLQKLIEGGRLLTVGIGDEPCTSMQYADGQYRVTSWADPDDDEYEQEEGSHALFLAAFVDMMSVATEIATAAEMFRDGSDE